MLTVLVSRYLDRQEVRRRDRREATTGTTAAVRPGPYGELGAPGHIDERPLQQQPFDDGCGPGTYGDGHRGCGHSRHHDLQRRHAPREDAGAVTRVGWAKATKIGREKGNKSVLTAHDAKDGYDEIELHCWAYKVR